MTMTDPIAVTGGLIRGTPAPHDVSITRFLGVPFAASPTGPNRFKPPQPVQPWDGIRVCDTQSPVNHQAPPPPSFHDPIAGVPHSEDILYLNIWVPDDARYQAPYPVYLWMHGGGWREGGNADDNFDGTGLAQKGVIVVVPNFRLGMLGFFSHPELSKESTYGGSGNQGLLDCVQALQWIKENISKLNGDPNRVTIGGQSSGATMTGILLYSPLTKGLIHRAIFQSGTRHPRDPHLINIAGGYNTLEKAEKDGEEVMRELGCSSLEELRQFNDCEKISNTALKRDHSLWGPPPLFRGVLDGHVMTKTYTETFADGPPNDIPVLAGHTSGEGAVYVEPRFDIEDLHQCVKERFSADPTFAERYYKIYPVKDEVPGKGPLDTWNESCRDHTRINLSLFAREWSRHAKSPVFGYFYTHAPPHYKGFTPDYSRPKVPGFTFGKGPLAGAFHSSDLPFTFNSLVSNDTRPWSERDRQVGETVSSIWANFMRYGDPNGPDETSKVKGVTGHWPSLVEDPQTLMEIGQKFEPIDVASKDHHDFWTEWIEKQDKAW